MSSNLQELRQQQKLKYLQTKQREEEVKKITEEDIEEQPIYAIRKEDTFAYTDDDLENWVITSVLPKECMMIVFSFLNEFDLTRKIFFVCRYWNVVAKHEEIWYSLYFKRFIRSNLKTNREAIKRPFNTFYDLFAHRASIRAKWLGTLQKDGENSKEKLPLNKNIKTYYLNFTHQELQNTFGKNYSSIVGRSAFQIRNSDDYTESITALAIDGEMMVSGNSNKSIRIWDLRTKQITKQLKGHRGTIGSIDILQNRIASCCLDHDPRVFIWDVEAGIPLTFLRNSNTMPMVRNALYIDKLVKFHDQNTLFVNSGNEIETYDLELGSWKYSPCRISNQPNANGDVEVISSFDVWNDQLALITSDGSVSIFDLRFNCCISKFNTNSTNQEQFEAMKIQFDKTKHSQIFVSVNYYDAQLFKHIGLIQCYNISSGKEVKRNRIQLQELDSSDRMDLMYFDFDEDKIIRIGSRGNVLFHQRETGIVKSGCPIMPRDSKSETMFLQTRPSCFAFDASKLIMGTNTGGIVEFSVGGNYWQNFIGGKTLQE